MFLQSASVIARFDIRFYKMRQALQSVTVIPKWDVTGVQAIV